MPAADADVGSNAFIVSTSAHTSWRLVAAASAASMTLVDPEEAAPQISERHPRGSPPASASTSVIPADTISGRGRTSSRDAGRTSVSLGTAESRFSRAGPGSTGKITGWCAGSANTGNEDMRTSDFREREPGGGLPANQSSFAFYSPRELCASEGQLSRGRIVEELNH